MRTRRLARFLRPYLPTFGLSLVATVLGSVLEGFSFVLLIPFLRALFGNSAALPAGATPNGVERLLDRTVGGLITDQPVDVAFRNVALLILLVVTVKNVLVYASRLWSAKVQERVVRDLRNALYTHLQGMRLDYFQRTRGGQLLTRMLADTEQAKTLFGDILSTLLQALATVSVYLAILIAMSWKLTLLSVAIAPLFVVTIRPLVRRLRRGVKTALTERGELTSIMQETVAGVRLVKAYGAEAYERRRFGDAAERYARGVIRVQRAALLTSPISETFGALATVILLGVGASMATGANPELRPEAVVGFLFVSLPAPGPLTFLVHLSA